MRWIHSRFLSCLLFWASGHLLTVTATSYLAQPLEATIQSATFIGTVECEVAGGIVAGYRVLESWKGPPKPGQHLRLRTSPDESGPSFPVALFGERFMVFAWEDPESSAPAGRERVPPLSWSKPLMWRSLRFDFVTHPFLGLERLDPKNEASIVAQRKSRVLGFLSSNADQQELAMLLGAFKIQSPNGAPSPDLRLADVFKRIQTSSSVEVFAQGLNQLRILGGEEWRRVVTRTLEYGSKRTLKFLGLFTDAEFPDKAEIIRTIELRDSPPAKTPTRVPDPVEFKIRQPSDTEREWVVQALRTHGDLSVAGPAFAWMIENRSAAVLSDLVEWTPPIRPNHRSDTAGYVLGSMYAKYCASNRVSSLTTLLKAKDPFVRVSAAVSLCFDDPVAGLQALKRLQTEPGDAGAWAALTLARRGRKEAVDQALDLIAPRPNPGPLSPYAKLSDQGAQLVVLLSNSARAAGVPFPESPYGRVMREWWGTHGSRISLRDPWMAELESERSD